MRVDFYQLERDGPEQVVPMLAAKAIGAGARLVVACSDTDGRQRLSDALWGHSPDSFLAHGDAGEPDDDRQPILLGEEGRRENGATMLLVTDGRWREPARGFERLLFLFLPDGVTDARVRWKALNDGDRHYWAQGEDGRWRERA